MRAGDVCEQDGAQDDVLVLGGVHVGAQGVGGAPQVGFEGEGGSLIHISHSRYPFNHSYRNESGSLTGVCTPNVRSKLCASLSRCTFRIRRDGCTFKRCPFPTRSSTLLAITLVCTGRKRSSTKVVQPSLICQRPYGVSSPCKSFGLSTM